MTVQRCPEVWQGQQCILEAGHTIPHRLDWGPTTTTSAAAPASAARPESGALTQRRVVLGLGALVVALVVFSFLRGTFAGGPTPPAPAAQPGSQAVYDRIAATTDCAALQGEFDRASRDHDAAPALSNGKAWTLGCMEAAQARMTGLGCP